MIDIYYGIPPHLHQLSSFPESDERDLTGKLDRKAPPKSTHSSSV